jgi:YceI-like domain
MQNSLRAGLLLGLSLLLTDCAREVRPPPPAPGLPPTPAADTRGATIYTVSAPDSSVSILVYRGGTLARFGHNHVMSSTTLKGRVWVHPDFPRSGVELWFAVAELVVDDPKARTAAGSDFPPEIPQADRDGTRANMLRTEVLDAEHYPTITLTSAKVAGTLAAPRLTVRIRIKDGSRDVEVPATVAIEGARLSASGEFDVQQSDFGIKPFTAALGALQVQDRLHIRFKVVATNAEGSAK